MDEYAQIYKHNTWQTKGKKKSQDLIPRCGKAFDKAQHPLMIKTLSEVGVEGAHLNLIKAIYERKQPTSQSMDENWKFSH